MPREHIEVRQSLGSMSTQTGPGCMVFIMLAGILWLFASFTPVDNNRAAYYQRKGMECYLKAMRHIGSKNDSCTYYTGKGDAYAEMMNLELEK